MSTPITVLVADDHLLICDLLAHRLESTEGIRLVGCVNDAKSAVVLAGVHDPDVVLIDTAMPGLDSFQAAQLIAAARPKTRILFLSDNCSDREVELALAVHAAGYFVKRESLDALVGAIRTITTGAAYYSPEAGNRLVMAERLAGQSSDKCTRASTLTMREIEIIRYVAKGLANKHIAQTAGISERTVGRHIENIMRKLGLHSRVELTRFALQEGLASA